MSKELPGLRLILLGVKEERNQRPWWLGDYSYSDLNSETLTISNFSAMKYGRNLDCLIREVAISDPALGPVHVLKADVSDGFYWIWLTTYECSQAGAIFSIRGRGQRFSSNTVNPPYGVEKSPPIFCTATETVVDLANAALR